VLARLPRQQHPDLLVGFENADDAGVFRIGPNEALVQTVDFFTPMVDDPYTFGRIAATNALSDVYAMGGHAITALALVCFPPDGDLDVLEQIMRGGLTTMQATGCVVVGGHSVRDAEIKFGYAVTGLIDPTAVKSNAGARRGDRLILTKSVGTGVITTALKQGKARPEWVDGAVRSMMTSNRKAAELAVARDAGVHGMTDITGFGLMGHAREIAMASNVRLLIDTSAVRLLEGALECIDMDCVPAGLNANREFAECFIEDRPRAHIPDAVRAALFDPQTSGGLLMAVDPDSAPQLIAALHAAEYPAVEVGSVIEGNPRIVLC
jgi:selenide,water dikinase